MKNENKALYKATSSIIRIISQKGSWIIIKFSDGTTKNVRAKELILPPGDRTASEIAQDHINSLQETKKVSSSSSSLTDPKDMSEGSWDIICPDCGNNFLTNKTENITCPGCHHKFVIRIHANKEHYSVGLGTTTTGRDTVDIADTTADMLRGLKLEDLYPIVANKLLDFTLKEDLSIFNNKKANQAYLDSDLTLETFLEQKYGHLNPGMQRMSLGNLLRGTLLKQQTLPPSES